MVGHFTAYKPAENPFIHIQIHVCVILANTVLELLDWCPVEIRKHVCVMFMNMGSLAIRNTRLTTQTNYYTTKLIVNIHRIVNMSNLVGITGYKRHGKDTVGDYLVNFHGYRKLAFADSLKKALSAIFKFNHNQLYGDLKETVDPFWNITPREAMQTIGTDLMRNLFRDDVWVKGLEREIMEIWKVDPSAKIIIPDVRFPNELEMVKRLGGCIVRVTRPSLLCSNEPNATPSTLALGCSASGEYDRLSKARNDLAPEQNVSFESHSSESHISSFVVDYDVANNGTIDDLYVNLYVHFFRIWR